MRKAVFLFILTSFIGLAISCSKSNSDDGNICDGVGLKSFADDVDPIIQTYCNQPSCHNPGSVNGPGSLTNYNEVFSARTKIREAIATGLMPQNTTLTQAQRKTIICWIDSGAPNN